MRRARVRHFVYMEIIRGCQMETITSRENAKIKYACRLREEEKLRTADGLFFAEGPKLCLELARGCTLQTLYATEKALAHTPELEAFAGKTVLVTEPVAQKLSGTKTSQDVFGVFEHPGWQAADILAKGRRILALEAVQDPGNVGTLLRSAAAFGFDGSTALYLSTQHIPCSRCAMVSRKLLDRIRAAARGRDSVTELLRLATAMAENCRRIPESLLHFRRELCADDVFSASGKRALILSHELTMTGAPIVLVSAVPVLRSMGFEVVVLGPADDGSLPLFLDAGAAVVTRSDCVMSSSLWGLATSADFVLANTVVEAAAVSTLNGSFVPVLWWLHDAFAGYPFIAHRIPKTLDSNVHVCAVGSHATAAMHSVRPDFSIEQLIYGLPDYAQESFPPYDISYAGGRPLFVTVGSFEPRKGQDIFCNAIRLLKPEVRQKAAFLFVGKAADKSLKNAVDALVEDYPDTVFYRKRLERPEIKSLMDQCACVVCASRDDPMPTFVTEGLIFGKPSIVSEHTGTAGLITEGVDGFVYRDDDPDQLAKVLEHAILHPDQLAAMKADCRKMYEKYYSNEAYVATLTRLVNELTT